MVLKPAVSKLVSRARDIPFIMKFCIETAIVEIALQVAADIETEGSPRGYAVESEVERHMVYMESLEEDPARAPVRILLGSGPLPDEDRVEALVPFNSGYKRALRMAALVLLEDLVNERLDKWGGAS